jgi:dihydroxyacid dehydratase/phosphogluconate dehydratase
VKEIADLLHLDGDRERRRQHQAENYNNDVILPRDKFGGIAVLRGNLARWRAHRR